MNVQDILKADAIVADLKVTSKKRLIRELAAIGSKLSDIDVDELASALMEREDLGSTATGFGVAIPHARIAGVDEVFGVFVKTAEPIFFDAVDHQGVDLVFALFAPKDANTEHLKALARVSRVLRNANVRDQLRRTDNVETIYTILTQIDHSVAA